MLRHGTVVKWPWWKIFNQTAENPFVSSQKKSGLMMHILEDEWVHMGGSFWQLEALK